MFKFIKTWFKKATMTEEQKIYQYLSESVSLVDLENRQREILYRGYKG